MKQSFQERHSQTTATIAFWEPIWRSPQGINKIFKKDITSTPFFVGDLPPLAHWLRIPTLPRSLLFPQHGLMATRRSFALHHHAAWYSPVVSWLSQLPKVILVIMQFTHTHTPGSSCAETSWDSTSQKRILSLCPGSSWLLLLWHILLAL